MLALLGIQLLLVVGLARNLNDASMCNFYGSSPIGKCSSMESNGSYSLSSEFYCSSGKVLQNTYLGTSCSGTPKYAAQSVYSTGVFWNCGGSNNCPIAWITTKYCKGHQNWWTKSAGVINTCLRSSNTTSVMIECKSTGVNETVYESSTTCTGKTINEYIPSGCHNNYTYTIECGAGRASFGLLVVLMVVYQLQLLL